MSPSACTRPRPRSPQCPDIGGDRLGRRDGGALCQTQLRRRKIEPRRDWVGALFNSYGVVMVDTKDNIKINSDETRAALEYLKKLMAVNPPEVYAWDDAGNNRWLISGKGSGIMNPPSAWAVA